MATVQRNVQIEASPQETMALCSDASRWPDWYPGMTEIDLVAPFPEEGARCESWGFKASWPLPRPFRVQ